MHQSSLYGTGVALITPFNSDGSIDYASLEALINHVIHGGVNYVVTLGTTGETSTLTTTEKLQVANATLKIVNQRVPVVIGIGGSSTAQVIEALSVLPTTQAEAILSVVPYYNKPSQQGIYAHYNAIAASTTKPIILYNVPGRTGRNMEAATTLALAHAHNHIVAIKEASGDMAQCMQLIANAPPHFMVLSGDDNLALAQIACGMKGVISVAANYYASEYSAMIQHSLRYECAQAQAILYKLLPALDYMFAENNPAGIKAYLAYSHITQQHTRLPVVPVSAALQQQIEAYLTLNTN